MSRPLRMEYPDAWYHVLNRGRRRELIFRDNRDYEIFLQTIQEACQSFHLRVTAYCLMPNHYHLLFETPNVNLSRCFRHIDGIYTQRFNRRHDHDGSLFRGRYKALLIEAESYLLQLVRYIHRNPLKAGLTETPEDYPWTSHEGYLSKDRKWSWLYKGVVLDMLGGNNASEKIQAYRKFVSGEDDREIIQIFSRRRWPAFLGSEKFIAGVKKKFFGKKVDSEVPLRKVLAPDLDRLIEAVARVYRIKREDLFSSRRGQYNEGRNVAIYLARRLRGDGLKEIGRAFGMGGYSTASSAVQRVKAEMERNELLRKSVHNLISIFSKSQEQT